MKIFAIIGLSLATAITGVAPAQAFPAMERSKIVTSDVQTVESYRSSWGRGRYGGNRIYRRHYRGDYYGGWWRDRGDYYGGWRGNRRYYNNDIGAAFGGFAAGAIIGGMLAQPRYYAPRYESRRYYSGGSHADWCYARYRSYRASDNTYQPYNGPRRRCLGP